MLKYLSKFVLEALPSIVATVIGAYIVAHYINPKTSDAPKAAVASTDSRATAASAKSADLKSADLKPADLQPGEGKAGEGKVTRAKIEEPSTAAGSESAAAPPARSAERTPEKSEKKDAASLARAAIERLRGSADHGGRGAPEPRSVVESARAEPQEPATPQPRNPAVVASAPAFPIPAPGATASITAAPPLPPPVIVAAPNFGRRSSEEAGLQPSPEATGSTDSKSAEQARLIPPADIPAASPEMQLQAQAAAAPAAGEQASLADHFLSTTKSFFRALTPHP